MGLPNKTKMREIEASAITKAVAKSAETVRQLIDIIKGENYRV